MFWKPNVAISGDPANFLVELSKGLKGYSCDKDWPQLLKSRDDEKEEANRYC